MTSEARLHSGDTTCFSSDKRTYHILYVHAEANMGLQGTHGFPQSKSDHKIQELHARKTQMENLKLVVATG
jgi:hypothetical protein